MTAISPETLAACIEQGAVTPAPAAPRRKGPPPRPPKPPVVLTRQEQDAREARHSARCAAAGRMGGAPLSCLTPAKLRLAARLKKQGKRMFQIARVLGVDDATIAHHFRGHYGAGPSRAMRDALKGRAKK